jgi:hypothetical protein
MVGKLQEVPGIPMESGNFNSIRPWLKLVNSVENCTKIRKIQTHFFGFLEKNSTTFVKLVNAVF